LIKILRPRPLGVTYDLINITELGVEESTRQSQFLFFNESPKSDFNHIFISYAKEDCQFARKLYEDLKSRGFDVWFDKESLLPGENWEIEIPKAVRKSKFFIPLFTNTSVSKRGYVQKEFRIALDVALEIP
jgi:hypothetical protein